MLARSSVGARASGVVQPSARRQHQVRGESAERIPGHLSDRLRYQESTRADAGTAAHRQLMDRSRRQNISRRQSAYQAELLLGVADRNGAGVASGGALPRRGFHAPQGDEGAGEGGLHSVVYLL